MTPSLDSLPEAKQFASLAAHEKSPKGPFLLGDVVEDVRTVFERLGDTIIYIPEFQMSVV